MKIVELFSILKKLNKPYYSFSDLQLILDLEKLSANKRIIDLQKQGFLIKLGRDIFIPSFMTIDEENVANYLYQPSYISFESALSYYDVIEDDKDVITIATLQKSIIREIGTKTAIWSKISSSLFFGYDKTDRFMIAKPEKAYCDLLYMSSLGKGEVDNYEINWSKLNIEKIKSYLDDYPESTKKLFYSLEIEKK